MKKAEKQIAQPTEIKQLIKRYDGFIIDLWGVVHNGVNPYPGVVDCLNYLISLNKPILFLSNAPRPSTLLMNKLIDFGIQVTVDMALSSGDIVREQLIHFNDPTFNHLGKCFYHLGAHGNQDILTGIPVHLTDQLENAQFILLTAYVDKEEDLNQYDQLLEKAVELKLPLICANPDKTVLNGNKLRYCAGVFAEKYEKMGGIVYYYGKPYLTIYEAAFKRFQEKGIYDKNQILMIGDTLETDIAGANTANIDSAIVLSGNMGLELEKAKSNNPNMLPDQFLLNLFQKTNISPTWILPDFFLTENNNKKL